MAQLFQIHPTSPQARLVSQVIAVLRGGGLIVYPTDSSYAFGWSIGNKAAAERTRRIRRVDDTHNFTLVCRDLSELATYARVDNAAYRVLRAHTPGPYTFILQATREVPRRLQNPKRRTIGLRVPDHPIPRMMLDVLGEPLMSSTLLLPGDDVPLTEPDEMAEQIGSRVDLIIDGGPCGVEPTTVVDLTDTVPRVLRHGRGSTASFES